MKIVFEHVPLSWAVDARPDCVKNAFTCQGWDAIEEWAEQAGIEEITDIMIDNWAINDMSEIGLDELRHDYDVSASVSDNDLLEAGMACGLILTSWESLHGYDVIIDCHVGIKELMQELDNI